MHFVFTKECLAFAHPSHPENPERIKRILDALKLKGFIEPRLCKKKELKLVHTEALIDSVEKGTFLETFDNPKYENIFHYACLSVGGAIKAMELAEKDIVFSLLRPPGHHAGRNFLGGFCYFNNIAVAVAKALEKFSKIAILDFDAHHGNGTQDIFIGRNEVLYVSLHQYPAFPGTGYESEQNCINFPLQPGTSHKDYISVFKKALEKIKAFKPELLAISAGFDGYKEEIITHMNLEIRTYENMGSLVADLLKDLEMNCFIVLEGGYSERVGECVKAFVKALEK